ncbi:hypothetical protein [Nocardia brasiliensis]|uniref:hypothetical protein n=1 Tax=Nocardia brasiliensis TaxID=37326 RepID=UPI002457ED02|nr:hypothetical protein [Nocardia brasiliensis]
MTTPRRPTIPVVAPPGAGFKVRGPSTRRSPLDCSGRLDRICDYGPALDHPVSGEEYMQVLLARQADWVARNSSPTTGDGLFRCMPLPEQFVRDEDASLVVLRERTPRPKPTPAPRYYRPAAYWRGKIARFEARAAKLAMPIITDRAAAGGAGLGRKRTARVQQAEDGRLREYAACQRSLAHARSMLRKADAREAG